MIGTITYYLQRAFNIHQQILQQPPLQILRTITWNTIQFTVIVSEEQKSIPVSSVDYIRLLAQLSLCTSFAPTFSSARIFTYLVCLQHGPSPQQSLVYDSLQAWFILSIFHKSFVKWLPQLQDYLGECEVRLLYIKYGILAIFLLRNSSCWYIY